MIVEQGGVKLHIWHGMIPYEIHDYNLDKYGQFRRIISEVDTGKIISDTPADLTK